MSDQKKKRQRINDLLDAETKPTFICLLYKSKITFFFFTEKGILTKIGSKTLNGIKRRKNLFRRYENCFEVMLIQ